MAKRPHVSWSRRYGEERARERGLFAKGVSYEARNRYIVEKSAEKLHTTISTLKELRRFFKGFDSASGYNLNDIKNWHPNRVRQVEKFGTYLHHLKSQPHVRVAPRGKNQKRALETFSGQHHPRQRAYVIHKTHPDEQVLVHEGGRIAIERKVSDKVGWLRSDFYFFLALLGYRPYGWDELYAATAELLPFMPEGDYFLYSELHGEIDVPQPKRSLLEIIMRYTQEYSQRDFAETIVGFKRIADSISSDAEYEKIFFRRQKRRKQRQEDWNKLRKQIHRSVKNKPIK